MSQKLENTMIRELSADELLAVSGAAPMEAEAGRYNAPKPPVVERCTTTIYDDGTSKRVCIPIRQPKPAPAPKRK